MRVLQVLLMPMPFNWYQNHSQDRWKSRLIPNTSQMCAISTCIWCKRGRRISIILTLVQTQLCCQQTRLSSRWTGANVRGLLNAPNSYITCTLKLSTSVGANNNPIIRASTWKTIRLAFTVEFLVGAKRSLWSIFWLLRINRRSFQDWCIWRIRLGHVSFWDFYAFFRHFDICGHWA